MNIDVYQDVIRRFFTGYNESNIKGFLKAKFPRLKRISDPSPKKTWVRFRPDKFEYYTINSDGSMMEEIYYLPTTDFNQDTEVTANYYDEEATKLLLEGRTALEVDFNEEKNALSLSPDGSVEYTARSAMDEAGDNVYVVLKEKGTDEEHRVDSTSPIRALAELQLYDKCMDNLGKSEDGILYF